MNIHEMIEKMGGLKAMASELGVSEQDAASGAAALTPAILGGFDRQAAAPSTGAGGLGGLLAKLGGAGLLANVLSPEPTDVSRGNGVLASIFGSKDVSRAVAEDASSKSGLKTEMLKKMLPIVAMMVAGYMAKKKKEKEKGLANDGSQTGGGNVLEGILRKMAQR